MLICDIIKQNFFGNCLVQGWVKTKRDSKIGISFIQLNDGSCLENLQIIAKNSLENYENILKLTAGCSIKVKGVIVKSIGKNQKIELRANNIEIIHLIKDSSHYPIQPKYHTLEYLREIPHLRQRTNVFGAINRLRSQISYFFHRFLYENKFILINTPIITSNDCEGGGSLFSIKTTGNKEFFNNNSFLTVSGQLHLEASALSLSNVYTFGPTFRAENSNTSRHLSEFWMLEIEIAFCNMIDIISFTKNMLKNIVKNILFECEKDLLFLNSYKKTDIKNHMKNLEKFDLDQISYSEAIKILEKNNNKFVYPVKWGIDLQSEHETYLTDKIYKKPLIITNYPKSIKSFYMKSNIDNKTVKSFDILFPGIGEIIGGSEREDNLDILNENIKKNEIKTNIDWYIDLRKYGSVPHSGFGLGLERFISYITGIKNVKDTIPFPRTTGNIIS